MRQLPVIQRPVDPEWKCHHSGDCCTKPAEVVMTKEEATTLVFHAPSTTQLEFRPVDDLFVAMKTGPCPLFVFNSCIVYANRPYNCRRFICMRPDTKAEPFEESGANMMDRVQTSRVARRRAQLEQRRAIRWADKHGWGKVKARDGRPDEDGAGAPGGEGGRPASSTPGGTGLLDANGRPVV